MSVVAPMIQRHWFVLLLPILIAASFVFVGSIDWRRDGQAAEMVLLFDACVSLPILYFLCYRGTLTGRQMAIRLVGIACLGLWFATWLVADEFESVLPRFSWVRTAGIVLLVMVELRLIVVAIKMAFSGKTTADELVSASGAPPWIARLMLLEARFWRWLWRTISRR